MLVSCIRFAEYRSDVLMFRCSREVSVRDFGQNQSLVPYLSFHMEWMLAPNVAYGNFVQSFNVSGYSVFSRSRVQTLLQMYELSPYTSIAMVRLLLESKYIHFWYEYLPLTHSASGVK